MASNNIGKWSAQATLDATGFTSGIAKIQADTKNLMASVKSLDFSGIKSSAQNIATTLGITAAVTGFLKLEAAVKEYVKAGAAAIRMQERLGQQLGITSAQAAATLAVAGQAGQSPEEVTSASMKALRKIGELRTSLAEGSTGGEAGASLRALGLDAAAFASMGNFQDQLGLLGDRLKTVGNAADRAAIAHAILGRGFEALMPQLRVGSEGMERFANLAEHFGVTVGRDATDSIKGTAAAARDFQVAQQLASEGLRAQFTIGYQMATHSADNYAAATQKLIELQPQLAAAVKEAGSVLGTVMGGVESAAIKILAGWNRIFSLFRNPPIPQGAGPTSGQLDEITMRQGNLNLHRQALRDQNAFINSLSEGDPRLSAAIDERVAMFRRVSQAELDLGAARSAAGLNHLTGLPIVPPGDATVAQINQNLIRPDQAVLGIQAWEQEAQQAGQTTLNAIAEATEGIERHNRAWGQTTEEIQRANFVRQGATDAELAAFDEQIAKMDELNRASQAMAARLATRSPLTVIEDDIANLIGMMQFSADSFSRGDAARGLGAILGRLPQLGQAPLLGSLSASGTDTAAVIQSSMAPQVDELAMVNAQLDAAAAERTRQTDFQRRILDALENGELRIAGFGAE